MTGGISYCFYFVATLLFITSESWADLSFQYSLKPLPKPFIDLSVLASLTLEGKTVNPGGFVCETWVFPRKVGPFYQAETDVFSAAYSQHVDHLYPMLLLDVHGNEEFETNFSYSAEFTETDIINTNRLGFQRFSPNCMSIAIKAEFAMELTMAMIVQKYARPHKDFFVFLAPSWNALNKAVNGSPQMKDLRYKYAYLPLTASKIAFWNGCERHNEALLPFDRKCDSHITGRHFVAVSSSIHPFVHFEPTGINGSLEAAGIMHSIFKQASLLHNFTFDLRYSGFLGSSGFKKNGVWKGAVGEVFAREADVAFSVATTVHRFPINDPSVTQCWITRYFYIRTPPFRTPWESVFWPLNAQVWLLTAAITVFMVFPVYYACIDLYFKEQRSGRPKYMFLELVDALFRILMEQSATVRHWKGTRVRLMVLLWTAFCLVVGTGYRSKLITFLTFLQQPEIPQTHNELSHSEYRLFFRWMGGVAYRHLTDSPDPMHKRIMRRAEMVNTSEDCMVKTLFAKNSAWMDYRINAEFAMDKYATLNPNIKENPIFVRSADSDYTCHIIWSFRKGSPFIESFDKVLLNILAAGLYDVWKNKDFYKMRVISSRWLKAQRVSPIRDRIEEVMETLTLGPKPLTNSSLLGLYLVLALGIGVSALAWIAENSEFYWKKYGRKLIFRQKQEALPVGDYTYNPSTGFAPVKSKVER